MKLGAEALALTVLRFVLCLSAGKTPMVYLVRLAVQHGQQATAAKTGVRSDQLTP